MALVIQQNNIIGIKFPFNFNSGKVDTSSNDQHIKEGLMQLLGTNKLEYINLPEYGCDIGSRLFDPVNVLALADGDIREAVTRFEPRVSVNNVSIDTSKQADGKVSIVVEFTIKGNQDTLKIEAAEVNFGSGGTINPFSETLINIPEY